MGEVVGPRDDHRASVERRYVRREALSALQLRVHGFDAVGGEDGRGAPVEELRELLGLVADGSCLLDPAVAQPDGAGPQVLRPAGVEGGDLGSLG